MLKKVVVIPDSFKGTIPSAEFCRIAGQVIKRHMPQCEVISIPVADGGEGSVDCFLTALGGERIDVQVKGPFFEESRAFYGIVNGDAAVIEMAAAAGLPQVAGREDPLRSTTYGVGQLIAAALDRGCRKIIMGLGGSCTNDGGCGAAAALGVVFRDGKGKAFVPTGGTLADIAEIDKSGLDPRLARIELITMCDINNPMYGPTGAAYVFAPQKGAKPEQVVLLDQGLRHLAACIRESLGLTVDELPGGGAAGAMGAGMVAFFQSQLVMGIEAVLDTVDFDHIARGADLVITGEGRLDSQSLHGKVIAGVASRARKLGAAVVVIVGDIDGDVSPAYDLGVTAVFTTNRRPQPFEVIRHQAGRYLQDTLEDIIRFAQAISR